MASNYKKNNFSAITITLVVILVVVVLFNIYLYFSNRYSRSETNQDMALDGDIVATIDENIDEKQSISCSKNVIKNGNDFLRNKKIEVVSSNTFEKIIIEHDEYGREIKWTSYNENDGYFYYTIIEYDNDGNEYKWTDYDDSDNIYDITYLKYDDQGRKVQELDENGNVRMQCIYNDDGTVTSIWLPNDVSVSKFVYDKYGNIIKETVYKNEQVDYYDINEYDENNVLIKRTSYDSNGSIRFTQTHKVIE